MIKTEDFAVKVLDWYDQHGRTQLPWQQNINPYRVWVSEIMLQQTQVNTVIDYFTRFMTALPTIDSLAEAKQDEVLHLWTGLGYYSRARNLHQTAKLIVKNHQGYFPKTIDELQALPGIGRSTAGAILSLAMSIRAPILDGNVKRVLTRFYAIDGYPAETKTAKQLWDIAEKLTPYKRVNHYTQAMMDLGATLCTRTKPACIICPLIIDCKARIQEKIELYPNRKPAQKLPQKYTTMAIFRCDDNILLYQRPNTGLWGGLWSLPEYTSYDQLKQYLFTNALTIINEQQLTPINHIFSHFKLTIEPWLINIDKVDEKTIKPTQCWYNLNNPPKLGLAAPVRKLLNYLA